MPKFSTTRKMPYSARQLFAIADDVDNYCKFVPLVKESRAYEVRPGANGGRTFKGVLVIRYSKLGINERLVSLVTSDPAVFTITSEAVGGPVKRLASQWAFADSADGGCEVTLDVDYKMRSRTMQFMLSGMFDLALRKIHAAFEARAHKLYGAPKLGAQKPHASA